MGVIKEHITTIGPTVVDFSTLYVSDPIPFRNHYLGTIAVDVALVDPVNASVDISAQWSSSYPDCVWHGLEDAMTISGQPSTQDINDPLPSGETILSVSDATGYTPGMFAALYDPNNPELSEFVWVRAVQSVEGGAIIELVDALRWSHDAGTRLTNIAQTWVPRLWFGNVDTPGPGVLPAAMLMARIVVHTDANSPALVRITASGYRPL